MQAARQLSRYGGRHGKHAAARIQDKAAWEAGRHSTEAGRQADREADSQASKQAGSEAPQARQAPRPAGRCTRARGTDKQAHV